MQEERYAVVIGGANIDIGGRALRPLVARDSNPGTVHVSLGGVGRNIAHNMALLGVNTQLLTALGDDANARRIEESCRSLGIDLSGARRVSGGRSSTYLFLSDPSGDMALAVSDMEICEAIDADYLRTQLSRINGAALAVVDANLPQNAIDFLAENCRVPLFADPVSVAKAEKLRALLPRLHTFKPNRMEAELLSGVRITDEPSLHAAARRLLSMGTRRVFISLGTDGVLAAEGSTLLHIPCCPAQMKNATGAGDSFTAALAWSYLSGANLDESARAAAAAAAITVESEDTISRTLCAAALRSRMKAARSK